MATGRIMELQAQHLAATIRAARDQLQRVQQARDQLVKEGRVGEGLVPERYAEAVHTDMNNPFVAPSVSLAREAEHVEAGIPAWDVLAIATCNAARSLKMDDRTGRITVGMEADILFLDPDPSLDIRALSRVAAVVENGRLHPPDDLRREAVR